MSGALGGVLAGALGLIALEVVTSSTSSSGGLSNITSLLTYPGQLAARWMSPTIALVPVTGSGAAAGEGGESLPAGEGSEKVPAAPAGTESGSTALSTLAQPS
jgi:hypothetical protein